MIIAMAGRRIDEISTRPPRFPLENLELVERRIRKLLEQEEATAVASSAACGADLLMLRQAGLLGLRRRVVLPCNRDTFREESVADCRGDWRFYDDILNEVIAKRDLLTIPDDEYPETNRIILDEAQAIGTACGEDVCALLVWDGKAEGKNDITEDFRNHARMRGLRVLEILTLQTCFVMQGFGDKTDLLTGRILNLDASYEVIREAVEDAGMRCVRSDEIIHSGTIDKPMYEWIYNADLVIADLSTYNINAAYELGIRYGVKSGSTLIIAENQFKNPFDVSHIAIVFYEHLGKDLGRKEAARFKGELTRRIKVLMSEAKADSPVYNFLPLRPPVEIDDEVKSTKPTTKPQTRPNPESSSGLAIGGNAKELLQDAREAMAAGNFLRAQQLFRIVRGMLPRDVYIVQQLALATYKSKMPDQLSALEQARQCLQELAPQTSNDPETLALWGTLHKSLWELTGDREALRVSINAYERGFYLKQDIFNGTTFAFLLNVRAALYETDGNTPEAITDFVLARRVRQEVIRYCEAALEPMNTSLSNEAKYWIVASMWEATIGLQDEAAAAEYGSSAYALAVATSMFDSTTRQIENLKSLLIMSPLKHCTT
jgi:hypothetical protein